MARSLVSASLVLLAVVGWEQPVMAQSSPTMNSVDRAFIRWDSQIERAQRNMGEIAARRGRSASLRDFGNRLEAEHVAAFSRLSQIEQSVGEKRAPLGAIHVAVEKRYAGMPADRFDVKFLRHEIGDHRNFLSHFRTEAAKGQNPELKAYASRQIGMLEADLHEAEMLLNRPGDSSPR